MNISYILGVVVGDTHILILVTLSNKKSLLSQCCNSDICHTAHWTAQVCLNTHVSVSQHQVKNSVFLHTKILYLSERIVESLC